MDVASICELLTKALRGDKQSIYWFKDAYLNGNLFEKDIKLAIFWLKLAKEYNIEGSETDLINLLLNGQDNATQKEAVDLLKELAESGDVPSMVKLSRAYSKGSGVTVDRQSAIYWMRRAVENKVKNADLELADLLYSGDELEQKESALLLKEMAENGNVSAMGRLGRAYRDGVGVKSDKKLAIFWMRRAAEHNAKKAMLELSDLLMAEKDFQMQSEAVQLLKQLRKQNVYSATGRLGRAYRDGKGVEVNFETAHELLCEAAKDNKKWANEAIELDHYVNNNDRIMNAIKQNKKIVIYNAGAHTSLSSLMILKMDMYPNEYSILLATLCDQSMLDSLEEHNIFDCVLTYREYPLQNEKKNLEQKLNNYFRTIIPHLDDVLNQTIISIIQPDQVNLFGALLSFRGIHYILMESMKNQLLVKWRFSMLVEKGIASEEMYRLHKKFGLLDGKSDNVSIITYFETDKVPDGVEDKIIIPNYDFISKMRELPDKDKQLICKTYGVTKLQKQYSNILLMNNLKSACNGNEYTVDNIPFVFQLLLDLFNLKNTLIKQHPLDLIDISNLFPNSDFVKDKYPVEMMNLFDYKFDNVVGISTTSVARLKPMCDNLIFVGRGYMTMAKYLPVLKTFFSMVNVKQFKHILIDINNSEPEHFFVKNYGYAIGIPDKTEVLQSYNGEENTLIVTRTPSHYDLLNSSSIVVLDYDGGDYDFIAKITSKANHSVIGDSTNHIKIISEKKIQTKTITMNYDNAGIEVTISN